jgi:hypothetical protein
MVKLRVEVRLPQFKRKNRSCLKYTWCTEVIVSTQLESSRFELRFFLWRFAKDSQLAGLAPGHRVYRKKELTLRLHTLREAFFLRRPFAVVLTCNYKNLLVTIIAPRPRLDVTRMGQVSLARVGLAMNVASSLIVRWRFLECGRLRAICALGAKPVTFSQKQEQPWSRQSPQATTKPAVSSRAGMKTIKRALRRTTLSV